MGKRVLSLLISTMLVSTLVTGCGTKIPTPDELLKNAWGTDEVESVDMDLVLDLGAEVDMSELTGEDASMNMDITADINMKSSEDVSYMEGNVGINLFGMSMDEAIKAYTVNDNSEITTYTYNTENDCWYKSEGESNSLIDTDSVTTLDTTMFSNLTMDEVTKDSMEYVLRGSVDFADLSNKLGMTTEDLFEGVNTNGVNMDEFKFDTVLTFDKETKLMKSMDFDINTDSIEMEEGIEFTKFKMTLKINKINGVDISVPSDIIENAVEELETGLDVPMNGEFTEEIEEESTSEPSTETSTLAQYVLGVDYAYEDDVKEVLNLYYSTAPSDEVIWSFLTFFNNYTAEELCEYMELYDYWSLEDKISLGILIDIGALDLDSVQAYGVDIVEMQSIITEYVETLK